MTKPRRLAARPSLTTLGVTLALLATACAGAATNAPATAPTTPVPSIAAATAAPSLTPVPGGKATPVPVASPPGTTDVAGFGRIYDALPPSFPRLPGQEPADTGAGPISGSFATNLDAGAASSSIAAALKAKGWAVDGGSPLEDGSVVLEASGPNACKAEIRFTPQSGSVIMSVLYGATCPYP